MNRPESAPLILDSEQKKLPPLPSIVRYLDDFADAWRSIRDPLSSSKWVIQADGAESIIDFDNFSQPVRDILKHWAVWALANLSPSTTVSYYQGLLTIYRQEGLSIFHKSISITPLALKEYWHSSILPNNGQFQLRSLKSYLFFACDMSLGNLGPGYVDFIGSFRLPKTDKYSAVRFGSVFLGADEEAEIISYFDEVNSRDLSLIGFEEIRMACVLCIAYQYAMRPIQIAKVRLSDVRIYLSSDGDSPAVHITFLRAKQRSTNKRLPMIRKVKREWSLIFERLYSLRLNDASAAAEEGALSDSYIGLTPSSVSNLISQATGDITGIKRTANHLRHSAAQRLVDAGASQVELAEFMGHSYADTGLVYFDASPAQADRINKALALSPIYSNVAEVARARTIDKAKLLRIAPDQQIGGVPHGIPIAGIGACDLGQSLCSKNPVLSCYSCRKFMAVADVDIHKEVLQKLRPVVRFFYDESRGETNSPAYMQLRRTLESVQAVIAQIDGDTDYA